MISNKDLRVEGGNIIINGEKHPLDPAVDALIKRANTVQGKLSALDAKLDAIEALEKTASGNPISLTGVAEAHAMALSMTIEPIQDLHGYTKPWAGGAGKNLLPMTLSGIKSANTNGTWNGNVYSFNGVTFSIQTDGDENVIGIKVNGTATARASFNLVTSSYITIDNLGLSLNTAYILSGCPIGGSANTYNIRYDSGGAWFYPIDAGNGSGFTFTSDTNTYRPMIFIESGTTFSDLTFYPMIRLATETDATFAPYTNICSITGSTSGEVQTTNGTDTNTAVITFGQTVYGGSVNFKTGEVTVTHANIASYNGESINEPWLSSLDNYVSGASPTTGAQVVYPLSTPTTLTLTPAELELLKGANTISGNGATINIGYIGR